MKYKKRHNIKDIFDVSSDEDSDVLNLRAKDYTPRRDRFPWRMLRKARYAVPTITIVFVVAVAVGISMTSQAQTTRFYPSKCLGSWRNVDNASGEQESLGGVLITTDNAARVSTTDEEIFCSDFAGEIPDSTKITSVSIKLALAVVGTGVEMSSSVVDVVPEEENSSGDEVIDDDASIDEEIPPGTSEETGEETSGLFSLRRAFAQDTDGEEENGNGSSEEKLPEPSGEEGTVESPSEEPSIPDEPVLSEEGGESTEADDSLEEQEIPPEVSEPQEEPFEEGEAEYVATDALLDVSYTIDGERWIRAGGVSRYDIFDGVATLWLPGMFWEEIASTQVRVAASEGIEDVDIQEVLLDSVWIEIDHEKIISEVSEESDADNLEDKASGEITLFDILLSTKRHFRANEEVELEFRIPSQEEIDQLKIEKQVELEVSEAEEAAKAAVEAAASEESGVEEEGGVDVSGNDSSIEAIETPEATSSPPLEAQPLPADGQGTTTEYTSPEEISEEVGGSGKSRNYVHIVSAFFSGLTSQIFQPVFAQEATSTEISGGALPGIESQASSTPVSTVVEPPKVTRVEIFDPGGSRVPTQPRVREAGNKVRITVPSFEDGFKPGRYTIRTEMVQGGQIFVSEETFTWGVLAMNFNKSVYTTGDEAYVQLAALNDGGNTLCDANLELILSTPKGISVVYKTANGTIIQSETCGADNVTDTPDYYFYHVVDVEGTHDITLTNLDTGHSVDDSFEVRDFTPYDVERVGATRINPFESDYTMTLFIGSEDGFVGSIVEEVPAVFQITSHGADHIELVDGKQQLIWNKELAAGERIMLRYTYQAPEVSPAVFFLGRLQLAEGQNIFERLFRRDPTVVFEETRQWQLASDAIGDIGHWRDNAGSQVPGTTFAAFNFASQQRNDGIYTKPNDSTIEIEEAGDYLIIGTMRFSDTSNARVGPQTRCNLTTGSGVLFTSYYSGYSRDLNHLGVQ